MNILLTNDDGINALGIKVLENILKKYGEVFVCAPSFEQSGKSCSLSVYKSAKGRRIDEHHFEVDGSPADCVEFAMVIFNKEFDLIVSGCNNGYNLATDIIYSGTCGACLQGLLASKKCVAISTEPKTDYSHLNNIVPFVLDYIFNNDLLSNEYFLNVNFAKEAKNEIKFTNLALRTNEKYYIEWQKDDEYCIERKDTIIISDENSDTSIVDRNYISISPVSNSYFHQKNLDELKQKILKK